MCIYAIFIHFSSIIITTIPSLAISLLPLHSRAVHLPSTIFHVITLHNRAKNCFSVPAEPLAMLVTFFLYLVRKRSLFDGSLGSGSANRSEERKKTAASARHKRAFVVTRGKAAAEEMRAKIPSRAINNPRVATSDSNLDNSFPSP